MAVEQPLNAKLAVDELRIGLKVSAAGNDDDTVTSGLV
jgi:hypothetical protein